MSSVPAIPPALPALPTSTQAALPITSLTRAPAAVREGSSQAKQAYATGQGFEEMLLEQLSQSLAQGNGLGGEGSGEGSGEAEGAPLEAGGGELQALLPQALTEGIMRDGGIGLATQLMNRLDPAAASRPASSAVTPAGTSDAAVQNGSAAGPTGGAQAVTAPPLLSSRTGGTSA